MLTYEMISGINPFKLRNKNKYEKLQMITDKDSEMMPKFSEEATSLLTGLLKRDVSTISSKNNSIELSLVNDSATTAFKKLRHTFSSTISTGRNSQRRKSSLNSCHE